MDCQHRLPWADAITNLQQKADQAAQDAAALKNAQAQNQQADHRAQITQSIQEAQVARAQKAASRQPGVVVAAVTAPGTALPVNVFHVYVDAFVGRFAEALEDMDKASAAWFGMFCMIASNVCIVIGLGMIVRDITNLMHSFMPFAMPTVPDIDLSAVINGDTDTSAPSPSSAPTS